MIKDHEFVDAYFTNNEYNVVESIWYSPKEKVYRTHIVKAENDNPQWQELLEIVTVDDLMERSYIRIQEQREIFAESIAQVASEGNDWAEVKEQLSKGSAEAFLNVLMFDQSDDDEANKEKLFIFKLALFDWEPIKNSDDKELKKSLRKAKTIIEAVYIVVTHVLSRPS